MQNPPPQKNPFCYNLSPFDLRRGVITAVSSALLLGAVQLALLPDAFALQGGAATSGWQTKPYAYVALDQDLHDVLHEFGGNLGLPVNLSDQVSGTVRERWSGLSAGEFLDRLARDDGLQWYCDGATLFVTAASEAVSKFISVPGLKLAELAAALGRSGLADQRYPLREGPTPDTVLISGPPRYAEVVEQYARTLGKSVPVAGARPLPGYALTIMRGSSSSRIAWQ